MRTDELKLTPGDVIDAFGPSVTLAYAELTAPERADLDLLLGSAGGLVMPSHEAARLAIQEYRERKLAK